MTISRARGRAAVRFLALFCLGVTACSDIEHYSLGRPAVSSLPPDFDLDGGFRTALMQCGKDFQADASFSVDASIGFYTALTPESVLLCGSSAQAALQPDCPLRFVVYCALKATGLADRYDVLMPQN